MNSLINFRLSVVLLSSVLIFLLSCSKDKTAVKKSDKAEIKSWKFGNKVSTIKGTNITVTMTSGTDITGLKADIELSSGASISPNPANSIDYTNPVSFKVTAEDGKTTKTYKVAVSVLNNGAEIKSWKFGGKLAKIRGTDITITFVYDTDVTALQVDVQLSAGASISPDPANGVDYTNPVTFTVKSEDGKTTKDYKVTVNVEDPIISWTAGFRDDDAYTANIDKSTGKIDIDLNSANFDTKVNLSAGVTIDKDPNNVTDWTDEVRFTTTKGLKTKTYTVKVKVGGKDIVKVTDLANLKNIMNGKTTGDFNYIDVSSVTNMYELFRNKVTFDGDISKWDVSNVTNMSNMFYNAKAFNQDIGDWDVSNVVNMLGMFRWTKVFNQDISSWDVSGVEDMAQMFGDTKAFNQDIGGWVVSNVANMSGMFQTAGAFNQNIGGWVVSNVTNMFAMFFEAKAFNQDIGGWDVVNVTNMGFMFKKAELFNQNLSLWTVTNVNSCDDFSDGSALTSANKPGFSCSE